MHHPPFPAHGPTGIPGVDPLSFEALRVFKHSMMLHRRLLAAVFAGDEPVHPAQAGCLQVLVDRDGVSQSDLAGLLHVSRPTVTTMLQKLESAGLVERHPDTADSRITRVSITHAGRELVERFRGSLAEVVNLSIGKLPEADRHELIRILGTVNAEVAEALTERGVTSAHHHPHPHDEEAHR